MSTADHEPAPSEYDDIEATILLARNSNKGTAPEAEAELSPELSSDCGFARRFQFICAFAEGGLGRIGKARDVSFGRVVAVKALKDEFQDDATAIKAFINECQLNAQLDHPSIVPIYAIGRNGHGHWEAAMKFITGSSFKEFIAECRKTYLEKKFSAAQEHHALRSRLEYFLKICEVIEYCHSLKIVHGDLKPENILIGRFGELYVMDWGCARGEGEKPKQVFGTPNYLPPEFFKNKTVSRQNDIYALGMILFELATLMHGVSPHATTCTNSSVNCCLVSDERNFRHYQGKLPISERLAAVIRKATAPGAAERYATVSDFAADVRHYVYEEEVSAKPDNLIQKLLRKIHRHRVRAVILTGITLLLLGGGWAYSAYSVIHARQLHDAETLRQIRLQNYTGLLNVAVSHRIMEAQSQLQLFADNLKTLLEQPECKSRRLNYTASDNAGYQKHPPAGMTRSEWYPEPVNFERMVHIPAATPGAAMALPTEEEYVRLCRKVVRHRLHSLLVNTFNENIEPLQNPQNMIQRIQVIWANGERFSYPGTYENPAQEAYARRFKDATLNPRASQINWSAPYVGVLGKPRIQCRYPLFDDDGRYLGQARLELRLDALLLPLLDANSRDPVHKLFVIFADGSVVTAADGKVAFVPAGRLSQEMRLLASRLEANGMNQFRTEYNGESYYVSGGRIYGTDAILVQMIEESAMGNHNHQDISL